MLFGFVCLCDSLSMFAPGIISNNWLPDSSVHFTETCSTSEWHSDSAILTPVLTMRVLKDPVSIWFLYIHHYVLAAITTLQDWILSCFHASIAISFSLDSALLHILLFHLFVSSWNVANQGHSVVKLITTIGSVEGINDTWGVKIQLVSPCNRDCQRTLL